LVFKHIVLDQSALMELWLDRPEAKAIGAIIREAKDLGVKLWAPASILLSVHENMLLEFEKTGVAREQAKLQTKQLVDRLFEEVDVLSLNGFAQKEIYEKAADYETAQVSASARCLPLENLRIVTLNPDFDTLNEVIALEPEQVLDWIHEEDDTQTENIPFIDLAAQQSQIRSTLEEKIQGVLSHGRYILGPEVMELEESLAGYVGVNHCIGVSSGTDALLIALMALDIGPGDEVITTPFSFIATGEVIAMLGAKPVFVDIEPKTYNIDPKLIQEAITNKTKAIAPVSLYGQCADFDSITKANPNGVPVIEDSAQSFGATYKGSKSCSFKDMAATSFFPSKPIGAYGEGGALFTDDDNLAEYFKQIRAHGETQRYQHQRLGLNGRLDSLQAAVLLTKMKNLSWELSRRIEIGSRYSELLSKIPGVTPPYIEPHNTSVYAQYTIRVQNRGLIQEALKQRNIPFAVHYPTPIHLQPVFEDFGYKQGDFPVAEKAAKEVISLPMHPYLSPKRQDRIVEAIKAGADNF
jgi:UDP-2-acetamido-2-deoxy-ribo-hexuluronate aminotransferase